ncbi:asparagine synthase-related protein [Sphingomonas sp. MMSM20]|uniref:asparagine synthase-related protein n=1 Tax=Sphingomonas lycopersici TaxID=2951807 RepID=UPI002237CEA1|nr:asparagine synthase-related protein [Sphingomonas lycopersici]MCW6530721.1 asparagine synthase-related protein [Sphingomonas lycopersici]
MSAPRFIARTHHGEPVALDERVDGLPRVFSSERVHVWGSEHCVAIGDRSCLIGHLFTRTRPSRRVSSFSQPEVEAILASRGASLMRDYWGGYVAFLHIPAGITRIIRDPSGTLPVYWRRIDGEFVLAAELGRPPFSRSDGLRVDPDALAVYLSSPHFAGQQTCLAGVSELLPGYALDLVAQQAIETCLWSPWDHIGAGTAGPGDAALDLRETVNDAVRSWGECFQSILLGMSGGLDSTIVAAGLAAGAANARGVSMYGPDPGGDERPFATMAAEAFGIALTVEAYGDWPVDLAKPIVEGSPRPFLAHYVQPIAQVRDRMRREEGIDAFFSGNGGDNVFCSLNSVTPIVDRILARSRPRSIAATIRDIARLTNADIFTIGRSVVARLARRSRRVSSIDQTFLDPARLAAAFERVTPHPWLEPRREVLPGANAHVRMLRRALGNDGFHSRAAYPPSIAPLLSQPIVELCLKVPSWAWVSGGVDRALARKAFRGVIPDVLLDRRGGGGPSGFVDRLYRQNEAMVLDELRSGFLQDHGIIAAAEIPDHARSGGGQHPLHPQRLLALLAADTWARHWEDG